jgi:Holliday junction DNA helicase RuvB
MKDFRIKIMISQRPNARSVSLHLPPFALVGATTKTDLLNAPLRSKFTLQTRLHYYPREILAKIITRSANLLSIEINPDCANEIASRSRGTPRIANNLLQFVRDFVQQTIITNIAKDVVKAALEMLEIDVGELNQMDKKIYKRRKRSTSHI